MCCCYHVCLCMPSSLKEVVCYFLCGLVSNVRMHCICLFSHRHTCIFCLTHNAIKAVCKLSHSLSCSQVVCWLFCNHATQFALAMPKLGPQNSNLSTNASNLVLCKACSSSYWTCLKFLATSLFTYYRHQTISIRLWWQLYFNLKCAPDGRWSRQW